MIQILEIFGNGFIILLLIFYSACYIFIIFKKFEFDAFDRIITYYQLLK